MPVLVALLSDSIQVIASASLRNVLSVRIMTPSWLSETPYHPFR